MRLKKIEIFGFKSFADRTEILFDEGVTCIVGPNGCGKSNISDSIRWVLGERSAKLLRGSKMEDVIFNGTEFRKPLAVAEVSLVIDNADRGLPIDYQEVTLTRRLYRSGESEYLINKTSCRLKDIQDLILDTGIGSNSYSMIEQGRIDYILNANADERRFLIEEAAGISKFKSKKEEAIRKLERTEENRLRLNDIIHEVHKNIQYAERQAKRAAKYREEYEKLKTFEIQKAFLDLNRLETEKTQISNEQAGLRSQNEQLEEQARETRQNQEIFKEELTQILSRFHDIESKQYALQSKLEQNAQQMRFHQEKRIEMAARQGQIEQEKLQLESNLLRYAQEISSKEKEIESLQNQKSQSYEALQEAKQSLQVAEEKIESMRKTLEEDKQKMFDAASEVSRIRSEYHRLSAYLESSGQQRRKQQAGAQRLEEESAQWKVRRESSQKQIVVLQEKLQGINLRKTNLDEEIQNLKVEMDSCEKEYVATERSLHENQTRLSMLVELDRAALAHEETLLGQDSVIKSFVTSLREIFTVQPGYEWALESALESFSRSLVAEDLNVAETLLTRILEQKAFPIGLLIHEQASTGSQEEKAVVLSAHPSIEGEISQFIQIKGGYEALFAPFFRNTYVVRSLETAVLLKEIWPLSEQSRFMTPEGVLVGPHRQIYCRTSHLSAEDNLFQRRAEIKTLESGATELNGKLESLKTRLESCQQIFVQCEQERLTLETEKLEVSIQKESFESLCRGMEDRIASFTREIQLNLFEFQEIQTQEEQSMLRKAQLEIELRMAEEKEKNLREYREELTKKFQEMEKNKSDLLQSYLEHKAIFANTEEKINLLQESLVLISEHDEQARKRITMLQEEWASLVEKEARLQKEDLALAEQQGLLEIERRELDVALELVRREKEAAEIQAASYQTAIQEISQKQQTIQADLHQMEMKVMDYHYQAKNISERLLQTYRIQLSELKPEDYALENQIPEELDEKIQDLRAKVESLGTVNLLAIEEFEELQQRYDFLMTQQKDLDDAKEQLLETIRKINKTTKGLFEQTFTEVQKNFQEYYETLFRGGQAKLILMDETNPLESGIDIVVRPPGKKLQHITLLSGGEKALTAIALLFALFKIKPSPFCVLDEVDAPLDEANVDRFLTVLRTFLHTSQFIIVTHNRKTIAMGDSLYGVTMEEPGVSKLVSVKIHVDLPAQPPAARPDALEEQVLV